MCIRDNPDVREMFEDELIASFDDDRDGLRRQAKESIKKIQRENKARYDRKRKEPTQYTEGDIVAIKRSQQGPGLKFSHKYLGPYEVRTEVIKALRNHRYILRRIGECEGPLQTSATDVIKPWLEDDYDDDEFSEEDEEKKDVEYSRRILSQDGRG